MVICVYVICPQNNLNVDGKPVLNLHLSEFQRVALDAVAPHLPHLEWKGVWRWDEGELAADQSIGTHVK